MGVVDAVVGDADHHALAGIVGPDIGDRGLDKMPLIGGEAVAGAARLHIHLHQPRGRAAMAVVDRIGEARQPLESWGGDEADVAVLSQPGRAAGDITDAGDGECVAVTIEVIGGQSAGGQVDEAVTAALAHPVGAGEGIGIGAVQMDRAILEYQPLDAGQAVCAFIDGAGAQVGDGGDAAGGGDLIIGAPAGEHRRIQPVAARQGVVAGLAHQHVVGVAARKLVVTTCTIERYSRAAALSHDIDAGIADEAFGRVIRKVDGDAAGTLDHQAVEALAAGDGAAGQIGGIDEQHIVAVAAIHVVGAGPADQHVIAAAAGKNVVAPGTVQPGAVAAGRELIVEAGADQNRGTGCGDRGCRLGRVHLLQQAAGFVFAHNVARALVDRTGAESVIAQGDLGDGAGLAAGQGDLGLGQHHIAVAAGIGRDRCKADRDDAMVGEAGQLARIGDAVAIGILPDPQIGIGGVGGVDAAVAVLVEPCEGGEAAAPARLVAEQFGGIVDRAVAVAVECEQAVIGADPAGGFSEAVGIDVESHRVVAAIGDLHPVAVEIDDQRVAEQGVPEAGTQRSTQRAADHAGREPGTDGDHPHRRQADRRDRGGGKCGTGHAAQNAAGGFGIADAGILVDRIERCIEVRQDGAVALDDATGQGVAADHFCQGVIDRADCRAEGGGNGARCGAEFGQLPAQGVAEIACEVAERVACGRKRIPSGRDRAVGGGSYGVADLIERVAGPVHEIAGRIAGPVQRVAQGIGGGIVHVAQGIADRLAGRVRPVDGIVERVGDGVGGVLGGIGHPVREIVPAVADGIGRIRGIVPQIADGVVHRIGGAVIGIVRPVRGGVPGIAHGVEHAVREAVPKVADGVAGAVQQIIEPIAAVAIAARPAIGGRAAIRSGTRAAIRIVGGRAGRAAIRRAAIARIIAARAAARRTTAAAEQGFNAAGGATAGHRKPGARKTGGGQGADRVVDRGRATARSTVVCGPAIQIREQVGRAIAVPPALGEGGPGLRRGILPGGALCVARRLRRVCGWPCRQQSDLCRVGCRAVDGTVAGDERQGGRVIARHGVALRGAG